jgi:hypothetical protein
MWNDRDRKKNDKALKKKKGLNKGREKELITERYGPTLTTH